ncbi:MAG TPA: class I SAM-dependent methyltransferase, partial [Polyangiaceae bacterium]
NLMRGNKVATAERKKCLARVSGTVLEVGFGSGHNLPWYPPGVRRLVAVDPSRESAKLAKKRIAEARFPIEYLPLGGEEISAPDHSFESVVSTFTLCTIPDPVAALERAELETP